MTSQLRLEPYGLGPALNQCCGGSVELLFEWIGPPAPDWLEALSSALEHGDRAVLATATSGPEPRHVVAHSVGRESSVPEELRASVRRMLGQGRSHQIEVAAADGRDWWLEQIAADKRPLLLFGAGHVGKALVKALEDLPFEIRWIDGREDEFPERIPENVTAILTDDPLAEVGNAGPDSIFIVMTHSHDLDEEICHDVLERGDFSFLGLIGSTTKRRRFVHRLGRRGISDADLERLICPIGLQGISGKEPATIALSLAAQLMAKPEEG
jgi:xanthine dehydrogenase accessory factor